MSRHELPSGGVVYLRDHTMLRGKDFKRIAQAVPKPAPGQKPDQMGVGLDITAGVIAALVTDWKLPYEPDPADDGTPREWVLPSVDVSMVFELSMADHTALSALVDQAQKAAFPAKPDPTDFADPLSPTEPASESGN